MSNGIEIDGLAAFKATSAAASRRLTGLNDAHDKAGQLLAEDGEARAPRDTGALAAGVRYHADSGVTTVDDAEDYWTFVDLGTQYMDAQPFLHDTIRDDEAAVVDVFLDEIEDTVRTIHGI